MALRSQDRPVFTRQEYEAALRADFMGYFCWAWSQLHPSQKLITGWHLQALAAALTKCATGETKRLIINLPPRNLKSEFASIVFPTWLLGLDPRNATNRTHRITTHYGVRAAIYGSRS